MAAAKYGLSSGSYWYVGSSSLTAYPSPSGTRKRPWPVSTTASLCGSNRRASHQVTRCAPPWPSGRAASTTARRIASCTCACTPPRTSCTRRHKRGTRRMRSNRIPRRSGKGPGTGLGLQHRRSNDFGCGHPTVDLQLLAQIRTRQAAHAACLAAARPNASRRSVSTAIPLTPSAPSATARPLSTREAAPAVARHRRHRSADRPSAHVRVAVVGRGGERLLDRAGRGPAKQVLRRARLVVGARAPPAAERLLADDGAGRLVVDVEVAR